MGLFERWANWIFRTATGSKQKRRLLTPLVAFIFICYVALFIVAALLTDRWLGFPSSHFLPWTAIAGCILLIPGLVLLLWTWFEFIRSRGTPVPINPPDKLITGGLYAYSRNPMVTGIYLIFFGLGFLIGSLSLIIFYTPLFITIMHIYIIRVEEKELELKFGREYLDYKKRVGRYITLRLQQKH